MEFIKSTKNESEKSDEPNFGHSEDEWGIKEDTKKIHIIEGYDVKWNIEKNGESG